MIGYTDFNLIEYSVSNKIMKNKLNYRHLEHLIRGVSNHRRIQILEQLEETPGMDVMKISRRFRINFKTASAHLRRLFLSGMITKKNAGANVVHHLTDRGLNILIFLRTLE